MFRSNNNKTDQVKTHVAAGADVAAALATDKKFRKQLLAAIPIGLVAAFAAIRIRRTAVRQETTVAPAARVAFYAGAFIYLGTFAVANNFDYRLVFLLLSRWLHLWDELASWAVAGLLVALVVATVPAVAVIRTSAFGRSTPDDPAEQGAS